MLTRIADLFVRSAEGLPLALIEVKNRQNLSLDLELHDMLLDHYHLLDGSIPYFLLVSQEKGLLWELQKRERVDRLPDYEFSLSNVVTHYWTKLQPGERLRGSELELVLFQWLSDIANGMVPPLQEPEQSLAQTHFWRDLRGATVQLEERL